MTSLSDHFIGRASLEKNKNDVSSWRFWCGTTDSRTQWIDNMRDQAKREYLTLMHWDKEDSIIYDYNEYGFRDSKFTHTRDILALGCSITQGTALPNEVIWPRLLEKITRCSVANLGVPGASAGTCFRLLHYWIDKLCPKTVVCLMPFIHRLELIDFDPNFNVKKYTTVDKSISDDYLKTYWVVDYNSMLDREKNLLAMKYLCDRSGKNLLIYYVENIPVQKNDRARDFSHPGVQYHSDFSKKVFNDIVQIT